MASAVTTDGRNFCWGRNTNGQLGDGTTADRPVPIAVGGGTLFRRLDLEFDRSCGIGPDARIACWGEYVGATPAPAPNPEGLDFAALAVGWYHACGLVPDGRAYCWGNNQGGQLGNGTTSLWEENPVPVVGP